MNFEFSTAFMGTLLDQLGKMGQREIARSYSACVRLLWSAGGAGIITAGTVLLKMRLLYMPVTLVSRGIMSTGNFALSFLLMQALGFRLATKQSPLLGAALAKRWKLRNEVRWSFRTQVLSALGNLAFVLPATFIVSRLIDLVNGSHSLSQVQAVQVLESLHPWKSVSIGYAAFTGFLLWLCTFLGGAIANRFHTFSKSTATAIFNILLGTLLAFVPMVGKALSIPLDVRHFTLSGGMMALATASLGLSKALSAGLLPAFFGVLMIGVLNFTVSFALAFGVAWADGRCDDLGEKSLSSTYSSF